MKKAEKKYPKLMILMFFLFAAVTIVLLTDLVKLTDRGLNIINHNNNNLKCLDFKYEISEIQYENKRLLFDILSRDYDSNLTKVTVIPDTSKTEYSSVISPVLRGGESKIIVINNISIESSFDVYIEDCRNDTLKNEKI